MPTRVRCRGTSLIFPALLWMLGTFLFVAGPAAAAPDPAEEFPAPELVPPDSEGRLPVLVRTAYGEGLVARVEELGGEMTRTFENADLMAALLPPGAVPRLREDARVDAIVRQR